MTIPELIELVKEEKLTKEQLEGYQTQISYLFQRMQIELAELEKSEAQFMAIEIDGETVAKTKLLWKNTKDGQRLIELKRYALALKEMLNSLKSRIYQLIY